MNAIMILFNKNSDATISIFRGNQMTETTNMVVLWKSEPRTEEEMLEAFIRFLECFEAPYVATFEMSYENPQANYRYQDEERAKRLESLTRADIIKFFKETTEKRPRASQLIGIGGDGALFLDKEKYTSGYEDFRLDRTGIHWGGLNPHLYSDGVKRIEGTGIATKPVPEEEVGRIIHATSKKIISSFNPEVFAFYREYNEYLNQSKILYFRNPYLFCMEFELGEFELGVLGDATQRKLDQIKAVLILDEIVRLLTENAEKCGYDVFQDPDGGVGIFEKCGLYRESREAHYAEIVPLGMLRRIIREKGVELPEGNIDRWYEHYVSVRDAKSSTWQ